ncbi:Hpt domain-containing protein [Herbaspirillum seropedicae]|uniref:Hpt domain-containing protein n=1 Tax=Herbaspirillum seropedicae TaxID=964 RepID=UPI0015DFC449|nr:Hpt domain-containing protein [Herbaspirillum seropedicae]
MQPGQDPHQYRHIDPSALLQAVGGDARTVASLARTFADSAPEIFARLARAVGEGNAEAARHESHALKGMSALFNARALTEQLQQTEAAARAGSLPAPEQWTQLQASFEQALEEIRRYAQSASAA